MPYKVVDIYKDLPREAGCSDCGKAGCFAFATAVYLQGEPLDACPHLEAARRVDMESKLSDGRAAGDGVRPEAAEQAAAFLVKKIAEVDDLRLLAERAEAELLEEQESIKIELLGRSYLVGRDSLEALEAGDEPNVWIKVLVLLYLTRATGEPLHDEWIAFRELPSTVGKHKTFDKWVERIAEIFTDRPADLVDAVKRCGGVAADPDSADDAYLFRALPRVPLKLLLWRGDEDFGARAALLLDRGVLDYLDQESIVFLAEALKSRLLGEEDPLG